MVDKALLLLEHSGVHKKYLYIFALIVFAVTCAVVFDLIFKAGRNELQPLYLSVKDCNVQQKKCKVSINILNFDISMDKNINYLKKFNINIFVENNEFSHVELINVSFNMKNMNMGSNRFTLKKVMSENNKEYWKGVALLPICITGRADWFAELEVITKENKYIIEFPILVKNLASR